MTILELVKKNPKRSLSHPESIFLAKRPDGVIVPVCFANLRFRRPREALLKQFPDLPNWEVVQEFLTQPEVDALSKPILTPCPAATIPPAR
jgi:hypothetical protein